MQTESQNQALRERILEKWSDEQLAALRAKHGQLTAMVVEDKIGLFKKPSRQAVGAASSFVNTDVMKYASILAENCFVDGDRELLDNDDYFFSIMPQLNDLVETKTVELLKV